MTLATRTPERMNGRVNGRVIPKGRRADHGALGGASGERPASSQASSSAKPAAVEPKILFQKFFKSVGPRTYAAQIKELANGNHLMVLTEGKRDRETNEVRKTRVFLYGEDFTAFFKLMGEVAAFMRANPLPDEVRQRRDKFWAKQAKASREA